MNWIPFPHKLLLHIYPLKAEPCHWSSGSDTVEGGIHTDARKLRPLQQVPPSCNNPRGLLSMRYLYIMIIDIQAPDSHNTLNDHSHCEDHHNYGNLIFYMLSSSRKSSCFSLPIPKNTYIYYVLMGREKKRQNLIIFTFCRSQAACSKLIPCYQQTWHQTIKW